MRRRIVLLVVLLILLVVAGFFYSQKSFAPQHIVTLAPTQIVTPSIPTSAPTNNIAFCAASDLNPEISLGAGAGNIYGTVTLKNISTHTCQILGGQFVAANYDTDAVKNIIITHTGQTQEQSFVLAPSQTLYSQIHYPNGPQCQSVGLNQTQVAFTYKISPSDEVIFKNQNGNTQQVVQTCTSSADITEIQIWNISTQPITP